MERRALLQWLLASGGLAAVNRLSAQELVTIGRDVHRTGAIQPDANHLPGTAGALDAAALDIVTVAAARILPAGDTPGATDAQVGTFIDRMLAGWHTAADRDRFAAGVQDLESRSQARFGHGFVQSSEAEQVALLEALDSEVTVLRQADAGAANAHWFAMLKYLTVWGYCTSEVGMRDTLHTWPMPMRYDGNAMVTG